MVCVVFDVQAIIRAQSMPILMCYRDRIIVMPFSVCSRHADVDPPHSSFMRYTHLQCLHISKSLSVSTIMENADVGNFTINPRTVNLSINPL